MKTLSDSEVEIVREYLDKQLISKSRVAAGDVWSAATNDITSFENEGQFKNALSQAFKNNKFPGLKTSRGRYGGIRRIKDGVCDEKVLKQPVLKEIKPVRAESPFKPVKAESPFSHPKIINKPPKIVLDEERIVLYPDDKHRHRNQYSLLINGKHYIHAMNAGQMRGFMKYVIKVEESAEGNVEAFDSFYECSDEQRELLDSLLYYCFGASIRINDKTISSNKI